uniref:Uncharacterized protein n=1 Tax=Aegilops tauschii subsp. strangulata TaxID=200361 RepID=A0A453DGP3_AEGTS
MQFWAKILNADPCLDYIQLANHLDERFSVCREH